MKIATELPIHFQSVLAALTDYDFCIGCTYRDKPEYAEFYRAQRRKGRFVILDNGAFEGELLEDDDLIDAMRELHPQEVVAPDVISSSKDTLERARGFIAKLHDAGLRTQVQVAPQGKNFAEWTQSYHDLANLPGVSTIGISYVGHFDVPEDCDYFGDIEPEETIRLRFFHYLAGNRELRSDRAHHLLGLFSPAALSWYAKYPFIRSIDTSFPIVCAMHRTRMTSGVAKFQDKLDYDATFTDDVLRLMIENILWMREECQK